MFIRLTTRICFNYSKRSLNETNLGVSLLSKQLVRNLISSIILVNLRSIFSHSRNKVSNCHPYLLVIIAATDFPFGNRCHRMNIRARTAIKYTCKHNNKNTFILRNPDSQLHLSFTYIGGRTPLWVKSYSIVTDKQQKKQVKVGRDL